MMISNPITVNGYLSQWQFRTSVQDDTCISYASVWREKALLEFAKLHDSEIQMQPSDYRDATYYTKYFRDKIVRVKNGDVLSAYVDKDDYERGCRSLLVSFSDGEISDPLVIQLDEKSDHTITRLDAKKLTKGNFNHRTVYLQAVVQGKLTFFLRFDMNIIRL
jgi:hypothetical protein